MKFRFLFLLLAAGCAIGPVKKYANHGLKMDVIATAAAGADLAPPKSYQFAPSAGEEPLLDEKLRELAAARLRALGYAQGEGGWLLACSHSVTPAEESIPEMHEKERYYEDPRTEYVTRMRHGSPVTEVRTINGKWKTRDKLVPARVLQVYLKKINLLIYAAQPGSLSPTGIPLWEGHVSSSGESADLLKAAPPMLRELCGEIPRPSGKPEIRFSQP